MTPDGYVSFEEARVMLYTSSSIVRTRMRQGLLRSILDNGRRYIYKEDVERLTRFMVTANVLARRLRMDKTSLENG